MDGWLDLRVDVSELANTMMTYLYIYKDLQSVWDNAISDIVKDQISFEEVMEYIDDKVKLGEKFKDR